MGEVVAQSAAVVDIVSDVEITLVRAKARGGQWWAIAELELVPAAALVHQAKAPVAADELAYRQALAVQSMADQHADDLVGAIRDELFNLLGRPGPNAERVMTLLFPAGAVGYTRVPLATQPAKMGKLATLLDTVTHPAIPAGWGPAHAVKVRDAAGKLRVAVAAATEAKGVFDQSSEVYTALARSAQTALARTKRLWKGYGRSEADIHLV
ncbi:MAG: hypothetical protein ABMB14_28175, partial [Myxococcota bacterium]